MAEPFVPDNVAPDLAPLYNWLAPDPDRQYGTFWPKSFYPAGSPAWVQNGPDARWAMPAILRDALAGALDLANSTYSGAITNRGIGTLLSNGAGAGGALAEKGALAAGGGRWWNRSNISLPMDEASRAARAAALGFDPNRLLFHGTYKPDFDAFRILHPALAAREGKPPGVWAAENPAVADNFAVPLPRSPQGSVIPTSQPPGFPEGPARIYPLVARFQKRGNINLAQPTIGRISGAQSPVLSTPGTMPSGRPTIPIFLNWGHKPTGSSANPTNCVRRSPYSIRRRGTAPTCLPPGPAYRASGRSRQRPVLGRSRTIRQVCRPICG